MAQFYSTVAAPRSRTTEVTRLDRSRNLGLITGASALGAVFTPASATSDITSARPGAVATGMRITLAARRF
jgi:hypothetical protein